MLADVRPMPKDEIIKVMRKMKRKANRINCDVREDGQWFMNINWDSWMPGSWRFTSMGRYLGSDKLQWVSLEYYPPFGGNIRFDVCISRSDKDIPKVEEVFDIYHGLLVKYGGLGKNRVSYFERL